MTFKKKFNLEIKFDVPKKKKKNYDETNFNYICLFI